MLFILNDSSLYNVSPNYLHFDCSMCIKALPVNFYMKYSMQHVATMLIKCSACQEKNCPPEKFILGQKFSVIVLKIFVLP